MRDQSLVRWSRGRIFTETSYKGQHIAIKLWIIEILTEMGGGDIGIYSDWLKTEVKLLFFHEIYVCLSILTPF